MMSNLSKPFSVIGATCVISLLTACGGSSPTPTPTETPTPASVETPTPTPVETPAPTPTPAEVTSTASITHGLGETITENLYGPGIRIASVGEIDDENGLTWTVPAVVHYTDDTMPFAPDLYNIDVEGHDYANVDLALAALDGENIINVDDGGELITAYIFADNYFEMYINGVPVGKDPVPFTEFNSNVVQFRVDSPFTVAMLLVDWEENLGTGTEDNRGNPYHPGDGGLVAVFKNSNGDIISVTDAGWKAQTYYTAPLTDITCLEESGTSRLSSTCSTDAPSSAESISGAHWARPDGWILEEFDDSSWPSASTFTNETVGVDNKLSYTNFINIFDDPTDDAAFIWASNLILDNEVIVRETVTF